MAERVSAELSSTVVRRYSCYYLDTLADVFVDLAGLQSRIARQVSDRPVPRDVLFLRRTARTHGNEV